MRLLIVDALNVFMHKLPTLWYMSFDVIKAEMLHFAAACEKAGYTPVMVLDLYKLCQVGQQKWRRRQRKLFMRSRVIPCSASDLLGTILAETDIAWTYARDMEADDLIIDIATRFSSVVLSGDKGFLRVPHRRYCVARSCSYTTCMALYQLDHAATCRCDAHDDAIPRIVLHQNAAKLQFYISELVQKQQMIKGVFYSCFDALPCMWCFMLPLRQHLYSALDIGIVRESHVCGTLSQRSRQLTWDNSSVPSRRYDGDFLQFCRGFVARYRYLVV